MATYKDFRFKKSEYEKAEEYEDTDAIILAIKNILLSKPGNYPLTPSFGMNVKKYQFDLLDNQTISNIQSELNKNIAQYIPELQGVTAEVRKIEDESGNPYLCFVIYDGTKDSNRATLIMKNNGDLVSVFNETH